MRPYDFALMMQHELDANAHKGDWATWMPTSTEAISELTHHFEKLALALGSGDRSVITEFCADLGNIAMKTAETHGVQPMAEAGDETILNWMCVVTTARLTELFPDPEVAAQVSAVSREYRERFDRWTETSRRWYPESKRKQDQILEGGH